MLILVDSSIWADHIRASLPALVVRLERGDVAVHPAVIGEIAMGSLRQRGGFLAMMAGLPHIDVATDAEVLGFVNRHQLFGLGIGWIDAHLLASVQLTAMARLWTRDRRLHEAATRLGLAAPLD